MNIVLFEPQIPQNTGNIIRTCRVTGANLILIEPLGFEFSEKTLRRAHLDYALDMNIKVKSSLEEVIDSLSSPFFFLSSKTNRSFYKEPLPQDVTLIFGNETKGLPPSIMHEYEKQLLKLPMIENVRCLNLSNAVAICIYEVERQNNFASMLSLNAL